MRFKRTLGACAVGVAMSTLAMLSGVASAQEKLVVWWTKGFYPAEDKALNEMIQRFEQKTNTNVELSLYAVQDVIPKTVAALSCRQTTPRGSC